VARIAYLAALKAASNKSTATIIRNNPVEGVSCYYATGLFIQLNGFGEGAEIRYTDTIWGFSSDAALLWTTAANIGWLLENDNV